MAETTPNRPPAAATGTLGKTPLVHLLVYALGKKLTGTIELSSSDGSGAAILFVQGEPARARTSARGLQSKPSEGEELKRKLRQIAGMHPSTEYAYYPDYDAFGAPGNARGLDPLPLLWGILREHPLAEHMTAGLARLGGSGVRLAAGADVSRLGLPSIEAHALEQIRGRSLTPPALAIAGRLDPRTAKLLVYLLLLTKQVDIAAMSQPPPPSSMPPPPDRPTPISSGSMPAASPPPTLSPQLSQQWRDVVERAATIDRADYFNMLDIARDATQSDVETAYFALAKRWHPDRLPPELAPIKSACARVFARMSEAHVTLADEEKRRRYMHLLADGGGSPEQQETVAKAVEAATNFQKAEVFFKRGDLAQAEAFCRKAVEADPTQADYHAFAAWLTALKPENQSPGQTADCIALLDRAISISNRCERAFFWRGMLHKRLGKDDLAVRDFQRAAALNPRNIDAAREVRLYEMRNGPVRRSVAPPVATRSSAPPSSPRPPAKPEPEKPGLLGRLFKPTK
jgi:tetratricopeptide (TPR) repeat protein